VTTRVEPIVAGANRQSVRVYIAMIKTASDKIELADSSGG
jgi:hypothetical protein